MGHARRAVPSDADELVRLRGLMLRGMSGSSVLRGMSGSSASSTSVPTRRTGGADTVEPA
ncbi:hypothetical protein [Micromonospora aurantiaca (nom. illeg.)]|uniref:hypothetical protein n=1 Tax=Micromonospora aurantiaca (nom. illeg.) TaxID=47850 RepID=UPI0016197DD7